MPQAEALRLILPAPDAHAVPIMCSEYYVKGHHAAKGASASPRSRLKRGQDGIARLRADAAVLHALLAAMPLALIATEGAGLRARLKDATNQGRLGARLARHDRSGRRADISAVQVEADATRQLLHMLLIAEAGVGAGCTRLGAINAGADTFDQFSLIDRQLLRKQLSHWLRIRHGGILSCLQRTPGRRLPGSRARPFLPTIQLWRRCCRLAPGPHPPAPSPARRGGARGRYATIQQNGHPGPSLARECGRRPGAVRP